MTEAEADEVRREVDYFASELTIYALAIAASDDEGRR